MSRSVYAHLALLAALSAAAAPRRWISLLQGTASSAGMRTVDKTTWSTVKPGEEFTFVVKYDATQHGERRDLQ